MIKIEEGKLIIEINHPCPEEFSSDLKEAIIGTMQYQDVIIIDPNKLHDINCILLKLLKNLEP